MSQIFAWQNSFFFQLQNTNDFPYKKGEMKKFFFKKKLRFLKSFHNHFICLFYTTWVFFLGMVTWIQLRAGSYHVKDCPISAKDNLFTPQLKDFFSTRRGGSTLMEMRLPRDFWHRWWRSSMCLPIFV